MARSPCWLINGNPIAGYSKQKDGIRLMFWSVADFYEEELLPGTGKFKEAPARVSACDSKIFSAKE